MEVVENTLHIDIPSSEEGAFSPPEPRATAFEIMARVETNCVAARLASSLKIFGTTNANNSVLVPTKLVFDAGASLLE